MLYLKQGMSLKKAQQTVEERAKELYEDYFSSGQHRASCKNLYIFCVIFGPSLTLCARHGYLSVYISITLVLKLTQST